MTNDFNRWLVFSFAGWLAGFCFANSSEAQLLKRFSRQNDCATGSVASQAFGFAIEENIDSKHIHIIEPNAAYLTVDVPEVSMDTTDAELIINGDPTVSSGPSRRFIVRDLEPEKEYRFQIVAITANRANVERMEVKTIILRSGDLQSVTMKPVRRRSIVEQELEQADRAGEERSGAFFDMNSPNWID